MPFGKVKQNPLKTLPAVVLRGLWLAAVTGVLLGVCVHSAKRAGESPAAYGNDFTVFYAAACQVRETGDPYHHPLAEHWPYLYPPLFAQLLVPLTCLSLPKAAFWWSLGSLMSAAGTLRLCEKNLLPSSDSRYRWCFRIGWLLVVERLVTGNLYLGQVNLWIAFLVTGAICLEPKPRQACWAGLALALAVTIKLTPGLFLLYLAARRSWRALAWTGAWGVGLNALSLAGLGSRGFSLVKEWFSTIVVQGWKFNWATASNQSLRGACERLFAHGATDLPGLPDATLVFLPQGQWWIWRVLAVAVLGAMIWLAWQSGKPQAPSFLTDRAASVACCACLLLSNLSWVNHFTLLMFPAAVVVRDALEAHSQTPSRLAIGMAALMCVIFGAGSYLWPAAWQVRLAAYSVMTGVLLVMVSYFLFTRLGRTKHRELADGCF